MPKLIFTTLLILVVISANAQHQVFDMIKYKGDRAASFTVVDSLGNKAFFDINEETVHGTFSKNGVTYKLNAPRPERKYKDVLGYQLRNSEYIVFFSNSWHTDLASVSFNFITNKTEQHLIPLNLSRESYFTSFTYENKLYFVSRLKDAKGIRIFTFLQGDRFDTRTVTFKNIDEGVSSFYSFLSPDNVGLINSTDLEEFEIASRKTKVNLFEKNLYISLDYAENTTTVIRIDLQDYKSSIFTYDYNSSVCIDKPKTSVNSFAGKNSSPISSGSFTIHNSFLYQDKLFQFTSCSAGIELKIKGLADGTVLKQFSVKEEDEEISFKNSAIIQENFPSLTQKELTIKQFVRRVKNSVCFVSVVDSSDSTVTVSLGGLQYYTSNYPTANSSFVVGSGSESFFYFQCIFSKKTLEPAF